MTELSDNRGAIWANKDKNKDTHPDFKGNATINGTKYWVSAWKRKPDANPKAPSLSFSFAVKEELETRPAAGPVEDDGSDEIPF
jgi:hypothetical protein